MALQYTLVVCHETLILGKSPIKWRPCPDKTLAVDWDIKHQIQGLFSGEICSFFSQNPLQINQTNKLTQLKRNLHVRLINAATAWLGLQLLQSQQRANKPMMSDNKLDAMATDIKPCTALYHTEMKITCYD